MSILSKFIDVTKPAEHRQAPPLPPVVLCGCGEHASMRVKRDGVELDTCNQCLTDKSNTGEVILGEIVAVYSIGCGHSKGDEQPAIKHLSPTDRGR